MFLWSSRAEHEACSTLYITGQTVLFSADVDVWLQFKAVNHFQLLSRQSANSLNMATNAYVLCCESTGKDEPLL